MFKGIDDTIVAVSSPPGWAARGIVRLSGPEAIPIADGLFTASDGVSLAQRAGFTRVMGTVRLEDGCRVPAEVYLYRAPRSYTRQDCVEVHTIGSPPVLAMVLEAVQSAGARLAEPGEFTARAFLSGAMDLSRAEAVAAAIQARSDTQLRAARKLQEGELSRRIVAWRERLAGLLGLVEADIDFAEEPIEFITPAALRGQLSELAREIEDLQHQAESTERFEVLPTILLVGRPNAGKSCLMTALSGLDRAICSAVAGTTRDILSAPIKLGSIEAMLLDAAGLHDDADELIRQAQQRVLSTAEHVDLLCLVVDLAEEPDEAAFHCLRSVRATPCVLAANKIDLLDHAESERRAARLVGTAPPSVKGVYPVSALWGTGLDSLRQVMAEQLGDRDDLAEDKAIALSARHRRALQTAGAALARAVSEAKAIGATIDRADVLAFELREALDALGEIIGEVTTDDLLGTVFANFCIGK
jgi:tRNA modification GTPase